MTGDDGVCRRKIDWHLMPLMCSEYFLFPELARVDAWLIRLFIQSSTCSYSSKTAHRVVVTQPCHVRRMQFADKTTLGQSAILGLL